MSEVAVLRLDAGEPASEHTVADRTPLEHAAIPAEHEHVVQFYQDDRVLFENVARFIVGGVEAKEPVVLVATARHQRAFLDVARTLGCDVDEALRSGAVVPLDADAMLARLLVDDMPDEERFARCIGDTIAALTSGGERRVRAYGEMVDVLWRDGKKQAALALESQWSALVRAHPFTLLCAYAMGGFYSAGEELEEVCAVHGHVIGADEPATIESLQERARSLEQEIEKRKELERALREALDREKHMRLEAERSMHFNDMFSGMLGHDLRNPLGAITMGATYIVRADVDDKTKRAANRIVSSAERMSRMIDQLLDFTRIRVGGGLRLEYSSLDLAEVCLKIKDELEAANPESFIELRTHGSGRGEWDHDRLQQVLSNIVGNAVSHGKDGAPVLVAIDGDDPLHVGVSVHNEGSVPPDVLPMLFEAFRGTKQVQRTQGLGLGLYISRQIVEAHGGTVFVSASSTSGTTMRIRLPRRRRS